MQKESQRSYTGLTHRESSYPFKVIWQVNGGAGIRHHCADSVKCTCSHCCSTPVLTECLGRVTEATQAIGTKVTVTFVRWKSGPEQIGGSWGRMAGGSGKGRGGSVGLSQREPPTPFPTSYPGPSRLPRHLLPRTDVWGPQNPDLLDPYAVYFPFMGELSPKKLPENHFKGSFKTLIDSISFAPLALNTFNSVLMSCPFTLSQLVIFPGNPCVPRDSLPAFSSSQGTF